VQSQSLQPVPINAGDGERAVLLRAVRAGAMAVTLKHYRHDFEQGTHAHEHAAIELIVSGWGRGTYRQREIISTPTRVEYFAPGASHSFRSGERGMCTMHVVVPAAMARREDRTGRALDLELDPSRCLGLSVTLLREITATDAADPLVVESLAYELVTEAARWPAGPRGRPAWIDALIEQLRHECCRGHSMTDLAAAHGLHPGHVAREFRRAVGVPVGEFARRLRAADAAHRIAAGEEPLSRVAHTCGYVDQAHLTRQAKWHTGLTPRRLRRVFKADYARQ